MSLKENFDSVVPSASPIRIMPAESVRTNCARTSTSSSNNPPRRQAVTAFSMPMDKDGGGMFDRIMSDSTKRTQVQKRGKVG